MKIFAYNNGSVSAKALAVALEAKKLKHEGKKIHVKGVLLNWGSSSFKGRAITFDKILNKPEAVALATNKLNTFRKLQEAGVKTPDWTVDAETARGWLRDRKDVVIRETLTGHSGQGIVIVTSEDYHAVVKDMGDAMIYNAPLYTKYEKKDQEYRIHVFNGEVIFEQRKARKKDVEDDKVNWKVRNHANGFIFAHQNLEVPKAVQEEAVKAVQALGLDFGAVDIMTNRKGAVFVLEVNTACGMEGETLNRYVQKLKEYQ